MLKITYYFLIFLSTSGGAVCRYIFCLVRTLAGVVLTRTCSGPTSTTKSSIRDAAFERFLELDWTSG